MDTTCLGRGVELSEWEPARPRLHLSSAVHLFVRRKSHALAAFCRDWMGGEVGGIKIKGGCVISRLLVHNSSLRINLSLITDINCTQVIFRFHLCPLIWQIIINLSTRPREISSTSGRRARIVRIRQAFDRSLRTDSADTLAAAGDSVSLEGHDVSTCMSLAGHRI